MKRNWIIIVILFLLAANAALMSVLIIDSRKAKLETDSQLNNKNPRDNRFRKAPGFEEHLAHELNLNEEQRKRLHELSAEFHRKKSSYNREIHQLKTKFFDELSTEAPDSSYQNLLADSLAKVQVNLILLDKEHYRNIRAICNDKQAKMMDSLGKLHFQKNRRKGEGFGRARQNQPN